MAEDNIAVGWQTSPSRRGTLAIIENSLFTIFTCTWSIQHLNVPGLEDKFWEKLVRKCKWAVFTVFFPEFLMAHAILEFVMAVDDMAELLKQQERPRRLVRPPWWLRGCRRFLGNSRDEEMAAGGHPAADGGQQKTEWTLTHCYFANMGGFYIQKDETETYLLTARHFADSWESVETLMVSKDDLNDKSKSDYFTKAIAAIQIAQLILSLIVRRARHLAFSQLETLTLAFAICGVLTYICYWYKPQGAGRPLRVQLADGRELPPNIRERTFDRLWEVLANSKTEDDSQPLARICNDNIPKAAPQKTHYALYVLTVLTAAFGSLHAIAWNFEFPTLAEQVLWRTATLVSTTVPPLALLAIPLSQILRPSGDSREFMRDCLYVMREYFWHTDNKEPVRTAIKQLEDAYDQIDHPKTHYRKIFGEKTTNSKFLEEQLFGFISGELQDSHPPMTREKFRKDFAKLVDILSWNSEMKEPNKKAKTGNWASEILDAFREFFRKLVGILSGNSAPKWPNEKVKLTNFRSKRLIEEAKTNIYPQTALFSEPVNLTIIYITGIMYCLARLSLIGVAFSSLRRMPDSVYTTTWTGNILSVQ